MYIFLRRSILDLKIPLMEIWVPSLFNEISPSIPKTKNSFICIFKHQALQVPQEKKSNYGSFTALFPQAMHFCRRPRCAFSKGIVLFLNMLHFLQKGATVPKLLCWFSRLLLGYIFTPMLWPSLSRN